MARYSRNVVIFLPLKVEELFCAVVLFLVVLGS
jgi:hypothetical protein